MPQANPAAQDFLNSRRSCPARTLTLPVPDHAALRPLIVAALRCPDHGKLEPWRLIVLERAALLRLAGLVPEVGTRLGKGPEDIAKQLSQFADAYLVVAVIESPKPSEKIPPIEQTYSVACVCLGLLNAALAAGWGANWLTGWAGHDRDFAETALGISRHERIAGFIHIGSASTVPPDRPRPDPEALTTWMSQ